MAAVLVAAWAASVTAAPFRILAASFLGGAGDDDVQGAAFGPDGSLYLAGNVDASWTPSGIEPASYPGAPIASPYARAFVARLSSDGRRLIGVLTFPPGRAFLTSVAATPQGIYAGGYLYPEAADPSPSPARLTRRCGHHGAYGGRPAVFRLDPALRQVTGQHVFEGEHFVWEVGANLGEFHWQPTDIAVFPDQEIAVAVDSGAHPHYFYGPDRIFRLSPDLQTARGEIEVALPRVDPPEKVSRYWPEFERWVYPAFGQTRLLRLRTDPQGHLAAGGWAPTKTSREPWWCPFLLVFNSDGTLLWQAFAPDPMSGHNDRLDGQVADSAIVSVAWEADGHLLFCGVSDGGNTILARDPRDFRRPLTPWHGTGPAARQGRCLFYGLAGRLRGDDGGLLQGTYFRHSEPRHPGSAPDWAVDVAPLPDGGAVAIGRRGWARPPPGFIRRLGPDLAEQWMEPLAGVDPMIIAACGHRVLIAGIAFGPDALVTAEAVQPRPGGREDGWWMLAEVAP